MSPIKFLDGDHKQHTKGGIVINGPRPTPLKIKQETHTIQKRHQSQIRKPIIIYMRSPKVIHTKPHDFMEIVQKLTGYSGPKHEQQQQKKKAIEDSGFCNDFNVTNETNTVMKSKSPVFNAPSNPYLTDIPLFTPNSSDYFFSPQSFLKLSDVVSSSPNTTNSISPGSLVEFMKRLPEY